MAVDFSSATVEWGIGPSTITLLELMKQTLGITDDSQDALLSMYLEMSGSFAEKYIDDIVVQRQVTERFVNSCFPKALRYSVVASVDEITVDGIDKLSESFVFFEDAIGWVVRPGDYTRDGSFKQVDIAYTAGYDPLPTDLGFAIVQGAIAYRTSANAGGISGVIKKESVVGVGSVEYDIASSSENTLGAIPSSVARVLDLYARIGA